MNIEITGIIESIKETEITTYQDKTYYKRKFIVTETSEQFNQSYLLEVSANQCDSLDNFRTGDMVTCKVNIRGKVYLDRVTGEKKCFNTLSVWNMWGSGTQQPSAQPQQEYRATNTGGSTHFTPAPNQPDDLPF